MRKEFLRKVNGFLSASPDPGEVNRLITSVFVSLNDISCEKSRLIKNLIISPGDQDLDRFDKFKDLFISYGYSRFNFEDLIEVFELVVSPVDKKVNGAIYTPRAIKEYIIFKSTELVRVDVREALVCDVACGCGGFLFSYAQYLRTRTSLSYYAIFSTLLYGVDITDYSIERTKITLSLLALFEKEDEDFEFNLKVGNSLDFDWRKEFSKVGEHNGFDLVIGNPPYVCAKNMGAGTRALLERWSVSLSGNPDLYIPFFQIGLEALNPKGVLGYITVNSFIRSVNGRKLRAYFQKNKYSISIADFGGEQVFKGRTTYTCICLIHRAQSQHVKYALVQSANLQTLEEDSFLSVPFSVLDDEKGWMLTNNVVRTAIEGIQKAGTPLEKFVDMRGGIATLKNQIYIFSPEKQVDGCYTFQREGRVYQVEVGICRDVLNANNIKSEDDIDRVKEKIIFPYSIDVKDGTLFDESNIARRVKLMREREFKARFPKAYSYLAEQKGQLAARDKGEGNYEAWYAYGRSQGLNNEGYKLLFPHISDKPYFVYSEDTELLFYSGFVLLSKDKKRLKILKSVLMSDVFWFYIKHTSKPYSSNYYGLGKNFLKSFGIPDFTLAEERTLLSGEKSQVLQLLLKKYDVSIPDLVPKMTLSD